jgi:hypothetical protein
VKWRCPGAVVEVAVHGGELYEYLVPFSLYRWEGFLKKRSNFILKTLPTYTN